MRSTGTMMTRPSTAIQMNVARPFSHLPMVKPSIAPRSTPATTAKRSIDFVKFHFMPPRYAGLPPGARERVG